MARIPIALELYSVREDLQRDMPGTLKAVAEMGYDGVEFAGFAGHPAQEVRAILDEVGLVACSSHTGVDQVQGDRLADTIAYNRTIGNSSLIIPGLPGDWTGTRANWLRTAGFFNDLAGKLAAEGMFTGYHNHHTEFAPLEGEAPWHTLFGNTVQGVVTQLDAGNALAGGADLMPLLTPYPGRAISVHLKPYSVAAGKSDMEAGFRPLIGDDDVPWAALFEWCETVGATEWYIVEYESDLFPPLEAVERCLKALKTMGK
jgi:sugar phosphate isomerase/epimerase